MPGRACYVQGHKSKPEGVKKLAQRLFKHFCSICPSVALPDCQSARLLLKNEACNVGLISFLTFIPHSKSKIVCVGGGESTSPTDWLSVFFYFFMIAILLKKCISIFVLYFNFCPVFQFLFYPWLWKKINCFDTLRCVRCLNEKEKKGKYKTNNVE